jgi:hypothetical protein
MREKRFSFRWAAIALVAASSPAFGQSVTLICGNQATIQSNYISYEIDFNKNTVTWRNSKVCPGTSHEVAAQITENAIRLDEHFDLQCGVPDPSSWYAVTIDRLTGAKTAVICSTKDGCGPPNPYGSCSKQDRKF